MNSDLKIIKKKYGEKMMHFCREFFPTLLEKEGLLSSLLLNNFKESHNLYNDLVEHNLLGEFKEYIYSLVDVEHLDDEQDGIASPEELLGSVGYDLYECHTEEEIQSFKKYYAKDEILCTFTNGNRLDTCRVFFAVKKNVDEIKREDFKNPQRQDEYGTSVISIQFEKLGGNRLSIKNRYNHKVNNPDSTFSNNLDNIVPGLTKSFEKYYGIKQRNVNKGFEIPSYTMASDGKYYKYNYEIDNVYYCPDNIIISYGEAFQLPKEKFIVFDYFVLDLEYKEINNHYSSRPSFYYKKDGLIGSIGKILKIEILNCGLFKKVFLYQEDGSLITIILDKENNIVGLDNPYVKEVPDNFLYYNKKCKMIRLENANVIKHNFMYYNADCDNIYLPNLESVAEHFMHCNKKIQCIFLPKLEEIPRYFLFNASLTIVIIPETTFISGISSTLKFVQYFYAPNLDENYYLTTELKFILEDIPYCYTPQMPEYCNTTDFLQDEEIVESLKLELKKKENIR